MDWGRGGAGAAIGDRGVSSEGKGERKEGSETYHSSLEREEGAAAP